MKNILFSTIKYGTIVGLGLGALVHTAFAAAVITPVTVTEIGRTEAVVQAKVDNLGMYRATVWFEWGETSAFGKPVAGMKDISVSGYAEHRFVGLKEFTTYYVRAAVMDSRGNTVYSPVATFTTGDIIASAPVVKKQEPVEQAVVVPTIVKKTDTVAPVKKEAPEIGTGVKKETPVKKTATTTTVTSSAQGASLLGIGGEAFPQTLIGWLVLFIVILIIVILAHMIYDTNQKRKKALEKAEQEAKIKAEMQK